MSNTEALRLAAELRRHARKIAHPAGDTPAVMVQAADALESLAQPAATVVERADSATGVVECGSLNVSDNAAPVLWIVRHREDTPATRPAVYYSEAEARRQAAQYLPGVARVVALFEPAAPVAPAAQLAHAPLHDDVLYLMADECETPALGE